MKCPACLLKHELSRVTLLDPSADDVSIVRFYDEGGTFHCHKTMTERWVCSHGHSGRAAASYTCPQPGCSFHGGVLITLN